jgi:hypothetical protein
MPRYESEDEFNQDQRNNYEKAKTIKVIEFECLCHKNSYETEKMRKDGEYPPTPGEGKWCIPELLVKGINK